ncbi:MAG: glycosyltransferase [Chitinophagaceae bacterium]|nr:glycosyltransferase [Chitinophagaceae bacterium]
MEQFIEKTILSVISQNYPNLEYIIIDGGSTDSTLSILEKYKKYFKVIISEPDNGMYDALNKGFSIATGDILAWINADDIYLPWTFKTVSRIFQKYDEVEWICGKPTFINEDYFCTRIYPFAGSKSRISIMNGYCRKGVYGYLQQESMFWRKTLFEKSGGLNLNYELAVDFELWVKFAQKAELYFVDTILSSFMVRKESLSSSNHKKYFSEVLQIIKGKCNVPFIGWNLFSKINFNHLFCILIFEKTPIVRFSRKKNDLVIKTTYRSVSCQSIYSLLRYFFI